MDAISCLAPPPPPALLSTSFADAAAIARALHFSSSTTTTTTMSPDSSASSSSSSLSHHHNHHSPLRLTALADLQSPYYAPPPVPVPRPPHAVATATCCDSVLQVADSPRRRRSPPAHLAPTAGARAGTKRRSRASKRAPTTYISTDAANFRLMVQQITGVQSDVSGSGVEEMAAMLQVHQATAALDAGNPQLLLPAGDEASTALRQHQLQLQLQQQQPCFPTLDSWNVVMYETNSAEML